MWFVAMESEMFPPSVNFASDEVKARYEVLPCLKLHFHFLEFHECSVMNVCDPHECSSCSNKAIHFCLHHYMEISDHFKPLRNHSLHSHCMKPYCDSFQQLFCCINLCSSVPFHTLLPLSRWDVLGIKFLKSLIPSLKIQF